MDPRIVLLGAIRQFLAQPLHAQTPEVLLQADLERLKVVREECLLEGPEAVIVFTVVGRDGGEVGSQCRCSPGAYAVLLLISILGQSVFIDRREKGGKPYLKVFGRAKGSAGLVFGRIVGGMDQGESTRYANGDALDLRHRNIEGGNASAATTRDPAWLYGEALQYAAGLPDGLLAGTAAEKSATAQGLLELALVRLQEERYSALDDAQAT